MTWRRQSAHAVAIDAASNGPLAGFVQPLAPMPRSLKVLIVDDEPDILKIGELSLGKLARWDVRVAHTSDEAIEMALRETPDVILLDMMLPDTDERATIAKLKQGRAPCVILMTAAGRSDRARACLDVGASGVIGKPFDPIELPAKILEILDLETATRGQR